jgi:UDP-galactopyranose mutase
MAEGDPYYPIPKPENAELYRRYKGLADEQEKVHFVGRLATYKYYNMDQVTGQALTTYAKIAGTDRKTAVAASVLTVPHLVQVAGSGHAPVLSGNGNGNGVVPVAHGNVKNASASQ